VSSHGTTALIDAFQAATSVAAELDVTPRWRRRKRQRLEARLYELCARADRERAGLGAPADAEGLADIIAARLGAARPEEAQ
jgi:hypothetical protein